MTILTRGQQSPARESPLPWRWAVAFSVGVGFIAAVLLRADPINGPWYWKWSWRDLGLLRTALCLSAGAVPLSCVLAWIESQSPGKSVWRLLSLLTLSNLLFQAGSALAELQSFHFLRSVIESPTATSYYNDAARIENLRGWLASYDTLELGLHSSTHPPGPIVVCWVLRSLFGQHGGAYAVAVAIALLSSLGVAVSYCLAGLWTCDHKTRLTASALYAMLPGSILFFPEFDQAYAIIGMLLILSWARAVEGRGEYWVTTGLLLFLATFFTYSLLTLGSFLLFVASRVAWPAPANGRALPNAAKAAFFSLLSCVLFYRALYAATGYNPVLAFSRALANQNRFAGLLHRPYGACVFYDLYDFLLSAGVLAGPLMASFFLRSIANKDLVTRQELGLTLAGIATILIVDFSGLLRAETARVWLFLQPLILPPVAHELRSLGLRPRSALLSLQWLILVILKARMTFIEP